jgi:anti-sigma regulatory factor (Ser/Thr protein kinase)
MLRPSSDELTIEVSDEGAGFDLDQCLADALSGDQIGKRGLPAMRRVADILEVDGGTVIMVLKKE